jgi:Zn ribbon nucleic-acid-binding protein
MSADLSYPESVIPPLRYQFCPMCAARLIRKVLFDDQIDRITCPACGWIQVSSNVVGVAVVARNERGIAVIFPPGEDPAEAAIREVVEETGLEAKITDCLGWKFINRSTWPGPLVQFFYEAQIVGGELKGSDEGPARIVPLSEFPPISPTRTGSQMAMQAYLAKVGGD